jgi:hypothetical protein
MTGVTGNSATCQESGYLTSFSLFGGGGGWGAQSKAVAAFCCISVQCITSRHIQTATNAACFVLAGR